MGREIKRVPLDFDWPLEKPWVGYVPPSDGRVPCMKCEGLEGRPTGYSRLGRSLYSLAEWEAARPILPSMATDLNSDELRFMEALNRSVAPEYRRLIRRNGLQDRMRPYVTGRIVTDPRMLCYDLMRHLAKTLRLPMKTFFCEVCKGKGTVVADPGQNKRSKRWKRKEPPKGEGWQVWETVSEGSPITPVFATAEELITFLCTVGSASDRESIARGWKSSLPTREQATAFVKAGWVPSGLVVQNQDGTTILKKDIEVAEVFENAG